MIPPSKGKLLYHITHIDNIPSILLYGLTPRKKLQEDGVHGFKDIADHEILSKREGYKKALSGYVPFHFYARNPFDGAVCKKYGAENMAIITIKRELYKNYKFFIIPSHPLDKDSPDIYPYEDGIKLVRWDILDGETGRDYHNPEIKNACMAECVISYTIPARGFHSIFVKNDNTKKDIMRMSNADVVDIQVSPYMFP